MNIKHIFFDLDHTLWDFDKNSALAFEKCFDTFSINLELNTFLEIYNPINEHYWGLYASNEVTKEVLKQKRFRDSFDHLNYEISDAIIHQISEKYLEYLPSFNFLHEGAKEILSCLHPKYKLHIITNGFNEVSFKKLEQSGISHFFEQIITSENAGAKKPDPHVFHFAMDKAQALPDESYMIGDNHEADFLGAKAVGMHAIHFDIHQTDKIKKEETIYSLNELKSYFCVS